MRSLAGRARARKAALVALVPLLACDRHVEGDALGREPGAPRAADAAPAAPSACAEGHAICASARELSRCEGGKARRKACPEDALCVDGACAALGDLASREDELFSLGDGEGFLDAWAFDGPLSADQARRFEEDPSAFVAGEPRRFRSLCGRAGHVEFPERRRGRGNARFVLAGELLAGRARSLRLQVGVRGRLRLYLGGALALDARGEIAAPLLVDGAFATARISAGRTDVLALLESEGEGAPSFSLRVRGERGERPDLRFAPRESSGPSCAVADLAVARAELFPVRGGFVARAWAGLSGLVPPGEGAFLRASLAPRSGKPRHLGDFPLSLPEPFSLPLYPLGKGEHELVLSVARPGAAEARLETLRVRYAGELHERIAALAELGTEVLGAPAPEGSRESFAHRVEVLREALARGERDRRWLARETEEAEAIGAAIAGGLDPYEGKTGVVERAYRSPIDGALQPYVVFVPPSYAKRKERRFPLVVAFHGRDRLPEHALRTVFGAAPKAGDDLERSARYLPAFPDLGAIVVAPFGFGNQAHRLMGEEDILRVVEETKKAYRVDPRRISITGYSLGGTVAFSLPLHFPHLFSAAEPLCGYPNLLGYESVRRHRREPFEEVMLARRYAANYAENGLHVPLRVVHGGKDGPERSEVVASRYRTLGQPVDFDVQQDLGHNVWDYAYEDGKAIAWLRGRRAPERPARVRLRTGEYRYDRAYWVRLVGMVSSERFAEIDASWEEREGRVTVSTENVEAFAVDAGALSPSGLEVKVDGRALRVPDGRAEALFVREGEGFVLAAGKPLREGKKRKGVSGPLDDVYRHAAVVVYGTTDPGRVETNRLVAEHHAAFDAFSGGKLPVVADSEIDDAFLRGRSLVLVGGPAENRVTALAVGALPLRFFEGGLELRGRRFEGEDVGVSLVYPSPFDGREYVALHAGVSARGTLTSRNIPALSPDYLVYDGRLVASPGALLLEGRPVLAGGFFDEAWR